MLHSVLCVTESLRHFYNAYVHVGTLTTFSYRSIYDFDSTKEWLFIYLYINIYIWSLHLPIRYYSPTDCFRGYETSGSHLRFMLRRSSLVECVSVLHGNRCLQSVEIFFLWQYVRPCLLKNPKYTFYTIKSSLKLAYKSEIKSCKVLIFKSLLQNTHKFWREIQQTKWHFWEERRVLPFVLHYYVQVYCEGD
jgi:hypothetical protein